MYKLENALSLWDSIGKYGSSQERVKRSELWNPYYSYLAKQCLGKPYQPSKQAVSLAEFMMREDILQSGDSLLEVGAGMGSFSLELAKRCAFVTALDINTDCLGVLKDRAKQAALDNIETLFTPWEKYAGSKKYDVAFSAMCPAICNQTEILRLESMAQRTVCLFTVTRGSYEKHRRELMKLFFDRKLAGMVTEALHYYNVLYLMERQPNLKTWSERMVKTASVGELVERYSIYLKIFGIDEAESIPELQKYFDQHSEDGIVHDECQMNTALVYWNVPESGIPNG